MKVIKLGGSLLDDAERRANALGAIVARWNAGEEIVLVHGGGKHIDAALKVAGIAKRTHAGLRITDDATLAIVVSVLGGQVNKMLVAELCALGVRAAGISGCDASTLVAERHEPIDGVDLGHVGHVTGGSGMLVRAMLNYGVMPVVSTIAQGPNGTLLNVNADSGAAAIAVALGATTLHFITDVPGLLGDDGKVVPHLDAKGVASMLGSPAVSGGMKPKLQAALSALQAGIGRISIGEEGGTTLVAA
ncbi:MAG TPA: acetylglutamate kinase [Thermoanaerobaculia bacterium]|nr:acetylglutamate kinase [Thermoanaerobaculia bacterium]